VNGPTLNIGRERQSCGMIRTSRDSLKFSVVVVGGVGGSTSVEILDTGSSSWRMGPELPFIIWGSQLVPDPEGGVVLVGGRTKVDGVNVSIDTLFRLSHAGDGARWVELAQKLKTKKGYLTAYPIPDEITSCSLNS